MATTISNPASLSSVRFAFFSEGYTDTGSEIPGEPLPPAPANLNAYRRGGGFVPNTPAFSAIATGVGDDLLKLSQYSGFTVPPSSAIATLTNHSADTYHRIFTGGFGEASALTRLTVNSNGQLQLLGSTGWSSSYSSSGSYIEINGVNYWDFPLENSSSGEINVQNWLIGGGASLYSCRGNILTGSTNPNGFTTFRNGTFGSWLNLTSSHDFSVLAYGISSNPDNTSTLILELQFARTDNLSNILGSCTITLDARGDYNEGVEEFE
jgi:hypothetical protein